MFMRAFILPFTSLHLFCLVGAYDKRNREDPTNKPWKNLSRSGLFFFGLNINHQILTFECVFFNSANGNMSSKL